MLGGGRRLLLLAAIEQPGDAVADQRADRGREGDGGETPDPAAAPERRAGDAAEQAADRPAAAAVAPVLLLALLG